jgi:hypothetical protein
MELIALAVVLGALLVAWNEPRHGLTAVLVVGFAMDPLRKVISGQPVMLTGAVAVVVCVLYASTWARHATDRPHVLFEVHPTLKAPTVFGLAWVLVEVWRGYEATGSPVVALIGVLAYAVPVLAILVGSVALRSIGDLERFLRTYVGIVTVVALTVLLSFAGFSHPLFAQVGTGLLAYAPHIGILQLHSGFLRGPELAGWHLAAGLCLLLVLAVGARRRVSWGWVVPCAAMMLPALLMTGRRKYIALVGAFLILWCGLAWAYRRARPVAAIGSLVLALALTGVVASEVRLAEGRTLALQQYVGRLLWAREQAEGRISNLAVDSLQYVLAENGVLGSGAGTGSQGAQHFGGGAEITGAAAEGGIGKVMAELGIPGLVLLAWFGLAVARCALRSLRGIGQVQPELVDTGAGLAAFLAANVLTFTVGHQVFGDPFVLCLLGILAGIVLQLPGSEPPRVPPAHAGMWVHRGSPLTHLPMATHS